MAWVSDWALLVSHPTVDESYPRRPYRRLTSCKNVVSCLLAMSHQVIISGILDILKICMAFDLRPLWKSLGMLW